MKVAIQEIKKARIHKGYSLREVARMTGLSVTFISNLERGVYKKPGWESLYLIAGTLGLDFKDLLKGFGHKMSPYVSVKKGGSYGG